jgi:hypothetical protein
VLIGGDPLGWNSTDPYQYPDRLSGSGCNSLVNPGSALNYIKTQCFAVPAAGHLGNAGRNSLTGPGLVNTDLSFFKNNKLSEKLSLQFRAEIFNLLNRANFAPPIDNNVVFNQDGSRVGNAGVLTATQTPARQVQFGVRVSF